MNLKELSKTLGLSQTTVSRALNGYPEVRDSTRQRVLDAAERFNYRPNPRAMGLATGRSLSIGHVIPVSTRHEIVNPIFADFIAGAGEVYSASGYDMTLSVVKDEDHERHYRDLATRRTVDGIIVHGPYAEDRRLDLLKSLDLPFVVHGRVQHAETDYNWLDVNNRSAFYRATNFLLDLGHRNIALINGLEYMDFARRRREGYLKALDDRGIDPSPNLIAHDEMSETQGYEAARRMLSSLDCPSAFLASSIISGIGVRRAVHEAGLTLGRDISLVVHDDELSYFRNDDDVPIFTAVRSSVREAGKLCARMLLDVIANPDLPPQHRLLEADLTVGRSTGPAPALRRALEEG